MIGDDTRSRVARQRKHHRVDSGAGVGFDRDGGESGRFAGFHGYAAKVDGAAELALEGWFEEVEFAHADAAGGDDDVDFAGCVAEGLFEGAGSNSCYCQCCCLRLGGVDE